MSKRKYKDPISKSVHELISGMHEVGVVDKTTMREFDKSCLVDSPPGANEIRRVRLANSASQAVFAKHIGVTTGLVSKWERGTAAPRGASLRALTAIGNAGLNVVRQGESAIRYRYKSESTSKKVATSASKVMRDPKASKAEKSVAASALTQKTKKK
jgi:putative transcriptional regulator